MRSRCFYLVMLATALAVGESTFAQTLGRFLEYTDVFQSTFDTSHPAVACSVVPTNTLPVPHVALD